VIAANSINRATSALERASREISIPKIAPTSPVHTRDTSSANPARATPHRPDTPRSVSITTTSERTRPSRTASSTSPYWRMVDSVCSRTCAIDD
jgi:hypothetical protein